MNVAEIIEQFEELSSIRWTDYCELCAREHEDALAADRARGADAIEDDEELERGLTVTDNHWLYGHDYNADRIGHYA